MEKTIYSGYYNAFMKSLHRINKYKNTCECREMRKAFVRNLQSAVATEYSIGRLSWDKARFYERKIEDYTRDCKM